MYDRIPRAYLSCDILIFNIPKNRVRVPPFRVLVTANGSGLVHETKYYKGEITDVATHVGGVSVYYAYWRRWVELERNERATQREYSITSSLIFYTLVYFIVIL